MYRTQWKQCLIALYYRYNFHCLAIVEATGKRLAAKKRDKHNCPF